MPSEPREARGGSLLTALGNRQHYLVTAKDSLLITKLLSLELSLDVGNVGDEVDGTTGYEHGGLSSENLSGNTVDLV